MKMKINIIEKVEGHKLYLYRALLTYFELSYLIFLTRINQSTPFDSWKHKFSLYNITLIGITCTALAFNLKCKTEYLVACIDGTIKCFNAETRGDLVGWMKGHEKAIISLSVHPTNADVCISFSIDLAQLWCLKTFQCKQKLSINAKKNVEIVRVCLQLAEYLRLLILLE